MAIFGIYSSNFWGVIQLKTNMIQLKNSEGNQLFEATICCHHDFQTNGLLTQISIRLSRPATRRLLDLHCNVE